MPGAEHTPDANFCFPLASPPPQVLVFKVLAQHHLTKFWRGRRRKLLSAPWGLRETLMPARGRGGHLIYFSFLLRYLPL